MKPSTRQQLDSRRGTGPASGAGRKRSPAAPCPLLAGGGGALLALLVTIGALGLAAGAGAAATSKASPGHSTSGRARASPVAGPLSGDKLAASATAPGPRTLPSSPAPPGDMVPAAGHHYGQSHGAAGHGKYYMYAESPKKGAYKAGFKRGNHKHQIMRKEAVHKGHAHGYFKWHDKKGKGSHKWELKHYDKKAKKQHY